MADIGESTKLLHGLDSILPFDMQAYRQPVSLWRLVEQYVPPHEHDEVKAMLGVSLVEQSQELHEEVDSLLEIWRDIRNENSGSTSPPFTLPEPPDQRDRLVQEICFFVDNVKEKAKEKGIDPQFILKRHNSQILDYATEVTRPGSSLVRTSLQPSDGRETPMVPITPNRQNQDLELADEVQSVNKKLNYLDFDEVCENLRSTLEKEVEQLMEDIQFLQNCLDSEADTRDSLTPHSASREPTLSELKGERSLLEKDLLATNQIKTTPQMVKPAFITNKVCLPGSSENSLSSTRSAPLKVDHSKTGPMRGKHEVNADPRSYISTSVKVKTHSPIKSSTDAPGITSSVKSVAVGLNISNDRNTRLTKSSLAMTRPNTFINKPESRVSLVKEIEVIQCHKQPSSIQSSQKTRAHNQSFTSPKTAATKQDASALTVGVMKRTVSPGRVKVVDLTAVLDAHPGRDDSSVPGFSSSSTSSAVVSPSSSCSARPGSAHAERFRKMVLECRDGD